MIEVEGVGEEAKPRAQTQRVFSFTPSQCSSQ
jgi:hypothetical protein